MLVNDIKALHRNKIGKISLHNTVVFSSVLVLVIVKRVRVHCQEESPC